MYTLSPFASQIKVNVGEPRSQINKVELTFNTSQISAVHSASGDEQKVLKRRLWGPYRISTLGGVWHLVQSGGKVHGPRRMLQKYFKSNFDPLSSGIDPN